MCRHMHASNYEHTCHRDVACAHVPPPPGALNPSRLPLLHKTHHNPSVSSCMFSCLSSPHIPPAPSPPPPTHTTYKQVHDEGSLGHKFFDSHRPHLGQAAQTHARICMRAHTHPCVNFMFMTGNPCTSSHARTHTHTHTNTHTHTREPYVHTCDRQAPVDQKDSEDASASLCWSEFWMEATWSVYTA